jgi:hypothetical protein
MATDSEEEAAGLGWTFGSYVFQDAFTKLGTAFRWMFWGLLLQLAGAAFAGGPLMALMFARAKFNPKLVLPGILAMAIGGIVLLIGEQKCLHLELPMGMTRSLPGHRWLRAAYWCHLGSWLLRMGRRFLDRGIVAAVLLPLQLAGFVFLLLFLRKTADVLARRDLKWLVDVIFVVAGLTVLSGASLAAEVFLKLEILKAFPPFLRLVFLVLPIVLFVAATGAYVVLLGRMASAATAFAKYLKEADGADPAHDDDQED